MTILLLSLITVLAIWCISIVLWQRVTLKWLEHLSSLLVLSLPFERIPSLETSFGTLKISHILVALACYVFALLFVKKDAGLYKKKVHPIALGVLLFYMFSVPSIYYILDFGEFLSVFVATSLSFLTLLFLTHFLADSWKTSWMLFQIGVWVIAFSLYQFVADMIGLPGRVSGVKHLFQKHVFGFPRIHATFNEPSYFGNVLFLFFSGHLIALAKNFDLTKYNKRIIPEWTSKYPQTFNILMLSIILLCFGISVAKSAWIVAPIFGLLVLITVVSRATFSRYIVRLVSSISAVFFTLITIFTVIPGTPLNTTFLHLLGTFQGETASFQERDAYLSGAVDGIRSFPVTGIGAGQFGTFGLDHINNRLAELGVQEVESTKEVIVFNVYAEVLLEYGLISFVIFLFIFGWPVYFALKNTINKPFNKLRKHELLLLIFGLYLVASIAQWNFISPLYINPIFIAAGIIYNIHYKHNYA